MPLRNVLEAGTVVHTSSSAPGSSKTHLLPALGLGPGSNPSTSLGQTRGDDSDDGHAWTSKATPAHVHLVLPRAVRASAYGVLFQGGFAGVGMWVWARIAGEREREEDGEEGGSGDGQSEAEEMIRLGRVWAEDTSQRQEFQIPFPPDLLVPPASSASSSSASAPTPNVASPAPSARRKTPTPASIARARLAAGWRPPLIRELKFEFDQSSDNQGRVTVYALELLGEADW